MNDRERPREFGSDEDRIVAERMAAVPLVVPEELRVRTRRALEERIFSPAPRRPLRRLALALAGTMLAGSALAYGLAARRRPPPAPASPPGSPPPIGRTHHPSRAAVSEPLPPEANPAPRKRRVARIGAPPPSSPWGTAEGPRWRPWSLAEEDDAAEESAPPAPEPRLVIAREGRPEISVVLAGDRVVGSVSGIPVALTIEAGQLVGKLGERNVSLWLHGHQAEGEIGGIPVTMQLVETRDGHQLRQGYSMRHSLPLGATRVEASARSLAWFGCDAPLGEIAAGTYQGRCASGREARVVIPPSWQRLPALTRLILLSFFLTERVP
jgi:hypothetical protein